jgi:hypothetical protein
MVRVRRVLACGLITVGLLVAPAGSALAAKPANQACLGADVAGYAQGGSDFGASVSGGASTTQGIGAAVQAHLAGEVPDEVVQNTCND